MGSFMREFKEFVMRGNVMDMAVGIIIGTAFTAIITSLTENIIDPLIKLATGGNGEIGLAIKVAEDVYIDFGAFISAIINFLLVALVLFCILKAMNNMHKAGEKMRHKDGEAEEAPAPTCPHCLEEVKEGATRCPHCAGEISA